MDFEYDNRTGPLDGRSAFSQISENVRRQPANQSSAAKKSIKRSNTDSAFARAEKTLTGTFSAFGSPTKTTVPGLRDPHSQPHFLHQPAPSAPSSPSKASKPLPPVPVYNSLFSTPRKLNIDVDDSSGGETPKSPEHNNDSDVTPENMGLRRALTKPSSDMVTFAAGGSSPTREREKEREKRRGSLWRTALDKMTSYSPGRGEVPRGDVSKAMYSHAAEKKIHKKRSREAKHQVVRHRRETISDSDDSEPPRTNRKTSGSANGQPPPADPNQPYWLAKFFKFITEHPTLPHILSWYAQLAFNLFLLGGFMYLVWSFWSTIQGDVDKKSHEAMADIMAEMAVCAKSYTTNDCDPSTRKPALETVCNNWYKCMNQDPGKVGRAKVSAHTFAEIFNSFVEPISWKAMIFTVIVVFACFGVSNFAFGLFRDKTAANAAANNHYYYGAPGGMQPPPTPQRTFSGQDAGFYGTPWHQPVGGLEPAPSGAYGQIEGQGSPTRRLGYQ